MHALDACGKFVLAGVAAFASLGTAHAGVTVLYAFKGGNDGAYPAGVIEDKAGNLYGTTAEGGAPCSLYGYTCGTVFKLAPDGTETVLYAFTGGNDGLDPWGGVIEDKAGNLYGTTSTGGTGGGGTVFKLAPDGTETVLHAFSGESHDNQPEAGLIQDKAGNLYGTTNGGYSGGGTVFKLAPDGTETVLHVFAGGSDGSAPDASLIQDKAGNLYGTTVQGGIGCHGYGCGTVFKVAPDGTETVLYAFAGGSDGSEPVAGLMKDSAGNLYGTTSGLGGGSAGTVFKLTPDGAETVLYSFPGIDGGGLLPLAGVIQDKAGNLYGTTYEGGVGNGCFRGCGTAFKLAPDGTETVLHAFTGGKDGGHSQAGLLRGADGHLYGTTTEGGKYGYGTVFKLRK